MAQHAALCERLITQVKSGEAQENKLRAQVTANLQAGNTELAGTLAMQHKQVEAMLQENRTQMETAEKTYKDLTKARNLVIEQAKARIEAVSHNIGSMKVQKATAEMTEMAAGMISSMGGSGETLNRLEEMVNEEREKAAGRARVAKDSLNSTDFQMKEAEQTALASQALADFAAKNGIALPNKTASLGEAPPLPTPVKKMATPTATFEG